MSNLVPLRAHAHDGTCGRTNEGDALLRKAVGELGVLAEKAIAWMDSLCRGCQWKRSIPLGNMSTRLSAASAANVNNLVYAELRIC